MKTISLSEELLDKLKIVEGKDLDEKIFNRIETNILLRLKECEEWIFKFESKYSMDFENFKKAWEEGNMANKFAHNNVMISV